MKDQLISFETAKLAKEKGYKGDTGKRGLNIQLSTLCYTIKENGYEEGHLNHVGVGIAAPTQSLLQKWLREIHNIQVFVAWTGLKSTNKYDVMWFKDVPKTSFDASYNTYEEALEAGLTEALKLI